MAGRSPKCDTTRKSLVWLRIRVPIQTLPWCRSNLPGGSTRPLERALRHPILPQQRDPSTFEPGDRSTFGGALYSSDGAREVPFESTVIVCDEQRRDIPTVDCVSFSKPRLNPTFDLISSPVGRAVRLDDDAVPFEGVENQARISRLPPRHVISHQTAGVAVSRHRIDPTEGQASE